MGAGVKIEIKLSLFLMMSLSEVLGHFYILYFAIPPTIEQMSGSADKPICFSATIFSFNRPG
jgi:hypothetical protein